MKAQTLSIAIPAPCEMDCPYCIAKMTWSPPVNRALQWSKGQLEKVGRYAAACGVEKVLITAKGEPLLAMADVAVALGAFRGWPVELQTRGEGLEPDLVGDLARLGLNVLALSVDNAEQIPWHAIETANRLGLTVRLVWVLYSEVPEPNLVFQEARARGIHQLTFRLPADVAGRPLSRIPEDLLERFLQAMERYPVIGHLAEGVAVRDCGGLALVVFPRCLQERADRADLRSLVYHQDGHLYSGWASPASRIF